MSARSDASHLLRSTLMAFVAAMLLLVAVVLPAEYGVDPMGAGRLLGLTALGDAKRISENTRGGASAHSHPRAPRNANVTINLAPREEIEYKAQLAQGEPMLYSWQVSGGPLYFEFHGEPTEGDWPKDFFQSYEIKSGASAAHGSFVAPFTGRHGWYWRNLSDQPASITLAASGYYTKLGRIEAGSGAMN